MTGIRRPAAPNLENAEACPATRPLIPMFDSVLPLIFRQHERLMCSELCLIHTLGSLGHHTLEALVAQGCMPQIHICDEAKETNIFGSAMQ
eukprot:4873936-Amphidinium_carterae.1